MTELPPELGYGGKRAHTAQTATFDLDELLASRLLIQGVSGSGKSHAIRSLLETTHGEIQHLIIDREGEFVTLRERFPYLIVGKGGDIPATPQAAGLLIRRMMELRVSTIIDLSELKKPEQREFVKRAFEELMGLPHTLQHPLLVVLDEGEVFAPEGEKSMALEAVVDVACRGRKRDFCLVVATTRLSKLNKDCSAELLNKLIGYTDDVDLQRAAEQLGMTREQRASLKRLPRGHFWAYGPAISRDPLLVRSQDTLTKRPERGKLRKPTPPAPKAIAALLTQLKDLPAEAVQEAKNVADLQRQMAEKDRKIRELERAKPAVPVAEVRVKEVQVDRPVPFVPEEELKAVEVATGVLSAAVIALRRAGKKGAPVPFQKPVGSRGFTPPPVTAPRVRPARLVAPASPGTLSKAERSILRVLVQYPEGRTVVQIALLTNYAHGGGGFRNALGSLRSAGFIDGKEQLTATPDGIEAAGDVAPLPSGTELLQQWKRQSSKAERLILEALEQHESPLTIDQIASLTNYEAGGGGFRNAIGRLRTLELISGGRGEPIALADELR